MKELYCLYAASHGIDYNLESKILTFFDGQAHDHNNKQCIHIIVLDDGVLESNESFTLSIIFKSPLYAGAISYTTIIIVEDTFDCKLIFTSFQLVLMLRK